MALRILILGASYGSLLASKLLMAGHRATLVCTSSTADLINREGTVVRFPLKGQVDPVAVASGELPGQLDACTPEQADPSRYDLVVLGMQESQYGQQGVRQLLARVAKARKPALAIMNMPPLPYLQRIPALRVEALETCFTEPAIWAGFDPVLVTLASPDPQAFRPADQPKNVLQVGLPTNFKAAPFGSAAATALLRRLERDIEDARFHGGEIPVKLKLHDSLFVPLAKWPMLMTGNYRCIEADGMVPIQQAVHGDLQRSREIYQWVCTLCERLGAQPGDLVPFDKYAQAAASLKKPSSAARALFGGAEHIERVDSLVQRIARQLAMRHPAIDEIVALVDARLAVNRAGQPEELEAA
ncbi:hypothetical protein ACPWT1_04445 [Ramlibacter sp. MMS24-I3-19]|uniref:hypothetical protein n=1 Tax=Ramlibacter sp. MMS24-I3-19 TaxID=3416606 RepID=UPI003D061254